jgi:hypothetical protein
VAARNPAMNRCRCLATRALLSHRDWGQPQGRAVRRDCPGISAGAQPGHLGAASASDAIMHAPARTRDRTLSRRRSTSRRRTHDRRRRLPQKRAAAT